MDDLISREWLKTGRWIEGKYKDIPQNPTNGDMIKAVFPDIALYEKKHDAIEISFNGVWWNAPYKRSTDENSDRDTGCIKNKGR